MPNIVDDSMPDNVESDKNLPPCIPLLRLITSFIMPKDKR